MSDKPEGQSIVGSRDSRSLQQSSRHDHQKNREVPSATKKTHLETNVSPSALIEAVVILDEPPEEIDGLGSNDFSDEATVSDEMVSAQTKGATETRSLDASGTNEKHARDMKASATGVAIPDQSHELADLRQQLGSKDELISALVCELEQVVEQLDRMQRTGSNRLQGSSAGVSALPAEVVEEHQQVMGDLQRVVQEWEALQASSVLGRIEAEIGELRSMVARGVGVLASGEAQRAETHQPDNQLEDVLSRLAIDRERDRSTDEGEAPSWEAMKRRMMGGEEPIERVAPRIDEVEDEINLDTTVAPRPVDLDGATRDELRQACAERDAYIVQLTRIIRSRHVVSLPDNWDDIAEVPEEQKARVDQLATRLEEQVRLAEVEMSLERARLSRERTQLQTEREKIEKHLKRLGLNSLDELETIAVDKGSTSDRRWMRFLGVNRRS